MASETPKPPTHPAGHHTTSKFVEAAEKDFAAIKKDVEKDLAALEKDVAPLVQTVEKDLATLEKDLTPLGRTVGKDVKPLEEFWIKFNNDWSFNLASALAYSLLGALFPIAVTLFAFLGLFLRTSDDRAQFIQQVISFLPNTNSANDFISTINHQGAFSFGFLGVLAFFVTIYFGSRLFVLIEGCFSIIYHVRQRTFVRQNLMAIGMLSLLIVLIPILVAPASLLTLLKSTPLNTIPGSDLFFRVANILVSLLVGWVLFQAIYMVVPNQKISFRNSWRGALASAVALEIYLLSFPLYASRLLGNYVGQVAFAVILLAFFYYFAIILLLGAHVNAFFAEGVRSTTVDLVNIIHATTSQIPKRVPRSTGEQQSLQTLQAQQAQQSKTSQAESQPTITDQPAPSSIIATEANTPAHDSEWVAPPLWEDY